MQINRLFEIIYILLERKLVTARELSERFEVSQRTIYRDIDYLCAAGIPIYTSKGKGGGISLLDNFVLNKSILSEKEQVDILSSLQGLNALNVPDIEPVIKKLATIFNKNNTSWIDVDFSYWGSNTVEKEKFNMLKTAILNGNIVTFDYFSSYGEKTERTVEPMKILFKGHGWYIWGFCKIKGDFRFFKITRMKNLVNTKQTFQRDILKVDWNNFCDHDNKLVMLVLKIESQMSYRIYDEFHQECIEKNDDGSFTVSVAFPESQWMYGYILSYGPSVEVLEPKYIRENIKGMLEEGLKKYL
ncbi:helix-turn-helix transcriptional regulator [Alkaliphilus peptidifermentans]|uniref:Predicted DNA-binding transcriptional regulator YafY, contains an HTH and WYL domains n=1 Tax=Alkaliphilus peptidifermentans DSM 18978 TaxID=1120976 RepID=A0A1G5IJN4_9FIRM|nr:YafY family protein [Alkaliphilus peptidifermentans]SCY76164.1 Predicted DNA-binding transcriptional regulator YafY, contains an HTH and WYL domains [Alkaliphilus peptidifermentans DSM 18978]